MSITSQLYQPLPLIRQPYQQVNSIPYPNPFDPGNPIYQWTQGNPPMIGGIGDAGGAVAGAVGNSLSDFWQKSGSTIILWVLGIGLLAIGTLGYVLSNFVHVQTPSLTVGTYRERIN